MTLYFYLYSLLFTRFETTSILDKSKLYVYDVYFIEQNGDTLTKEKISFKPSDNPWKYQKEYQKEIEYIYMPDYSGLKRFIHPLKGFEKRIERNTKKSLNHKSWSNYTWINKYEKTGFVESDSILWIHPPRSNQYCYNDLTAFPEVKFNELKEGGKWESKNYILKGYPSNKEFVGIRNDSYKVERLLSYPLFSQQLEECWLIETTSTHSKLPESRANFIFHRNYGFISMEYFFYNGIKIIYKLQQIEI
jgi:hypothetical protein